MVVSANHLRTIASIQCSAALSTQVLSRRYVYEVVWKISGLAQDARTLRRQLMAKILAAEAHVFIQKFMGFAGNEYSSRIRDGDRRKDYTVGPSWSTYFQARAGALLMDRELINFLLDLETSEAAATIPYCRLEAEFPFHSQIDCEFITWASDIAELNPENINLISQATRLLEIIKFPDQRIYSNFWADYDKFMRNEVSKCQILAVTSTERRTEIGSTSSMDSPRTVRRSPRRASGSISSMQHSPRILMTVTELSKERTANPESAPLNRRGRLGGISIGRGRLIPPASNRKPRLLRSAVDSAFGRSICLHS